MADVGEIRARLVLSSDQFNQGMQQARTQMDRTAQSASKTKEAFDKIQKASLGFATAVAEYLLQVLELRLTSSRR
jgi:flagellar hook-basal body complex protein FliE